MSTLGILVGGGPAPGINSVISAAAINAINNGWKVIGILEGYHFLSSGDTSMVKELKIEDVSRLHFCGGSALRTSRANPTTSKEKMDNVIKSLKKLGVTHLVSIGGDDTAYSASQVEEASAGSIKVCHVPKTIDNDLPLPEGTPTFGFETARSVGFDITQNIMEDARTATRWYFLVAMGRKAGHLALGIGKSAGAHLSLISEEFKGKITLKSICDILEGSIIKRLASGRKDGVAVLAEGLAEYLSESEVSDLACAERDLHGHIRLAEVDLGKILKAELKKRLEKYSEKITIVNKNIGYELRCAQPVPFDIEYTRELGYHASQFLFGGGTGAMITIQGGRCAPVKFSDMKDSATGKTKVRLVNVDSDNFNIARRYMIRLEKADFEGKRLKTLAKVSGKSESEFLEHFSDLRKSL